MFEQLLISELFAIVLVFCRVGSAMMLMPGIGEQFVQARARLLLAVAISVALAPVLAPNLPPLPVGMAELILLLGSEIMVGLFIGFLMRLLTVVLEVVGTYIGIQAGLSSATVFNPAMSDQGAIVAVFIGLTGMTLLFVTDMHHLMLRALFDSYSLFVPNRLPPVGDFSELFVRTLSRVFALGIQLAGPLTVTMTILFIALGILSRLMPQLQIFFVALPLQILIGMGLLAVTLPILMFYYFQLFSDMVGGLLRP